MLDLKYTGKIKKDLKLCQKRGLDLRLLEKVIDTLRIPEPLSARNRSMTCAANTRVLKNAILLPTGC